MFGQSLLSAFGSAACTTDTDQLFTTDVQTTSVATYQLNNATTSIPSNTYPGTPSNITYAAGKFGNAAEFNGSNSIITLANTSSLSQANNFTWSYWVKPNGFTANGTVFRLTSNSYTSHEIRSNGIIFFYWGNAGLTTSSGVITDGVWQHVAITKSSTSGVVIYVNGVSVATSSNTANADNASATNRIGGWDGTNFGFTGSLDQIRIFNTALPQAAVTALYNETTTTATYDYVDYQLANPNSVAYYKMSDATDQLGNYNGTATDVNFNTEGKFGFAGAFNGSSSKIALGTNTFNSLTSFSFSCWVNLNNAPTGYEYLFDGWDYQNSSRGIGIRINPSGNIQAQTGFSNSVTTITSSGTITHSVWTHIAVSITQSNSTISINGNTESPQSNGGFDFHTGTTYNLGVFIYTSSIYEYFLDGKLDQIRIYDSALSAANVTTLYNEVYCVPTIVPTDYFEPVLYTGNGSTKSITSLNFAPDLIWIKERSGTDRHVLIDTIRGTNSQLSSQDSNAETTYSSNLVSFDTNGFTLGSASETNGSNDTYVAWNWKAGGIAVSNTDGTITSQVSANTDAGFSIVKYTGNGGNATLGSGLNQQVEMVICKSTESVSQWITYHKDLTGNVSGDNPYNLYLNGTDAQLDLTSFGAYNSFTSSVFPVTRQSVSTAHNNNNNIDYIAYCFHSVDGMSRVGSYVGGGSTDVPIILGFRPAFVMIKNATDGGGSDGWVMYDNKRQISAREPQNDNILYANYSLAEQSNDPQRGIEFSSNGFVANQNYNPTNGSGDTIIFLAIA